MSDLSRLLEDVYRSGSPEQGPSWASESALDEVFADWVPGPPADACEAERAYANTPDAAQELAAALELEDDAPAPAADPFEPLQALLEEALRRAPDVIDPEPDVDLVEATQAVEVETEGQVEDEVEPAPDELVVLDVAPAPEPVAGFVPPTPVRGWSRTDDDILPAGRARRSLLRRR